MTHNYACVDYDTLGNMVITPYDGAQVTAPAVVQGDEPWGLEAMDYEMWREGQVQGLLGNHMRHMCACQAVEAAIDG